MTKASAFFLLLTLIPLPGIAGNESGGGGGDTYACYQDITCMRKTYKLAEYRRELVGSEIVNDEYCEFNTESELIQYIAYPKGNLVKSYLKDIKEWNELNNNQIKKVGTLSLKESFQKVREFIKPFETIQKNVYDTLESRLADFENGGLVVSRDSVLNDLDDSSEIIKLKKINGLTCFEKQLAIQQFQEVPGHIPMLRIDHEFLNALDGIDKVGLLLHEAFYYAFSSYYLTSDAIRLLVGKVLSGEFSSMKEIEQVAFLIKHGLFTEFGGEHELLIDVMSNNNFTELYALKLNGKRIALSNKKITPETLISQITFKKGDNFIYNTFDCQPLWKENYIPASQTCKLSVHYRGNGQLNPNFSLNLNATFKKPILSKLGLEYTYSWSEKSLNISTHYDSLLLSKQQKNGQSVLDLANELQNTTPIDTSAVMTFKSLLSISKDPYDSTLHKMLDIACGENNEFTVSIHELSNFIDKGVYPPTFISKCKFDLIDNVPYPMASKEGFWEKNMFYRRPFKSKESIFFIDDRVDFLLSSHEKVVINFKPLDYKQGKYRMTFQSTKGLFNKTRILGSFDFIINKISVSSGNHIDASIDSIISQDPKILKLFESDCGPLVSGQSIKMSNINWGKWITMYRVCE